MTETLRTACERLELSRRRLRLAMQHNAQAPGARDSPLQLAGHMAADAVHSAVQPIAQRNPIGLVLGAAVAGGLLAWGRPWRWVFTPTVIATVLPQLVSRAMGGMPPLSWMNLLASFSRRHAKPGSSATFRPL